MSTQKGKIRLIIFMAFSLILVIILISRFFYLMIILPNKGITQPMRLPKIERGPILDRNGNILAITTMLNSVAVWIPYLDNIKDTCELLSSTLDIDKTDLIKKLSSNSGFVWIKRKITQLNQKK